MAEGSLTTGMGEALGLVHLRLLRIYLVYASSAGACSVPRDVSVYAVFRSRLIIPFHFYFLMFTHKIWRGGLKPHPLPCQTTCSRTDEENSAGLTIFKNIWSSADAFSRGESRSSMIHKFNSFRSKNSHLVVA